MIYIPYELFVRLYKEAQCYEDMDLFIAERGWQEWMDSYGIIDVANILKKSFIISRLTVRDICDRTGLSVPKIAAKYAINQRTLERWVQGINDPSDYDKTFLAYVVFAEEVNGEHYE